MFAERFAAEFDSSEATKKTWLTYGGQAVREIQERVYPAVSYEDFGNRAIARIRAARAAYPDASKETLSYIALDAFFDPIMMGRPDRNAVVQIADLRVKDGKESGWPASLFDPKDRHAPLEGDKKSSYSSAGETGLGAAVLTVPNINNTLGREQMDPDLARKLEAHSGPLILDLRGGGVGSLPAAVELAEWFLPVDSLVMTSKTRGGQTSVRTEEDNGREPIAPLLILIDETAQSAPTTLAAALQDHGVGKIAGEVPREIKITADSIHHLKTCPPGIEFCVVGFPVGEIIRPSGVRLADGLKVDYPIDPKDRAALIETVNTWLGRTKTAAAR